LRSGWRETYISTFNAITNNWSAKVNILSFSTKQEIKIFNFKPKKSTLMKTLLISTLLLLAVTSYSQKRHLLFNGSNLKEWTIYVNDKSVNPLNYFYVKEGLIETVGVPMGYLRTKKEYSDYRLHIEWCYPEKPTNSGVFLHTNGVDKLWPAHYQCQLKHGNAGDLIVHGVGVSATVGDSIYTSTEKLKPIAAKMHKSNEKNAGEWNSYDITCKGNTIEVKVNGVLQNRATNCSMTKGGIGLQAEGSRIQFRNLWIEQLGKD
jgi:hypothetical protein